MTTEEAIGEIVGTNYGETQCHRETMELALFALRAQQEREKNEPLTLEQLREMDGDPVWDKARDEWTLCHVYYPRPDCEIHAEFLPMAGALASSDFEINRYYRYKPEGSDSDV